MCSFKFGMKFTIDWINFCTNKTLKKPSIRSCLQIFNESDQMVIVRIGLNRRPITSNVLAYNDNCRTKAIENNLNNFVSLGVKAIFFSNVRVKNTILQQSNFRAFLKWKFRFLVCTNKLIKLYVYVMVNVEKKFNCKSGIHLQGDFASGFALQSLPLTWGTGPSWLRIFCLLFLAQSALFA